MERFFQKDSGNLEMLKRSIESPEIDQELIPILERFFKLPITPTESCYGHVEKWKKPYLSYVEDELKNSQDENIQKEFSRGVKELTDKINERIGQEVIKILKKFVDYGAGPKEYILSFEVIDKGMWKRLGDRLSEIVWDEFLKYLDSLG